MEISKWKWNNIVADFVIHLFRTVRGQGFGWMIVDRLREYSPLTCEYEDINVKTCTIVHKRDCKVAWCAQSNPRQRS